MVTKLLRNKITAHVEHRKMLPEATFSTQWRSGLMSKIFFSLCSFENLEENNLVTKKLIELHSKFTLKSFCFVQFCFTLRQSYSYYSLTYYNNGNQVLNTKFEINVCEQHYTFFIRMVIFSPEPGYSYVLIKFEPPIFLGYSQNIHGRQ